MLDSSVQFVLGTVTIDNTPVPNVNPVSGFIIGNLNPGEARTVSFQVVVQSAKWFRKLYKSSEYSFRTSSRHSIATCYTNGRK